MTKEYRNSIPKYERIIMGCLAASGENVSNIAEEFNTNRQLVYTQKEKIEKPLKIILM